MTELVQRDIHWARKITERLRLQATNYSEAREKVLSTLTEARDGGAADLLGYASWTAYMAEVFGDAPLRLERDARQELVAELSEAGMSTRAIAPIIGATEGTVRNDLKSGAKDYAPESRPFTAEEVAELEAADDTSDLTVDVGTGEVIDPPKITGMDGKQYTRPEQKKPKAEAITSRFSSAVTDLNRLLDRFHRISEDDGFRRNTGTINTLHHADITRAINELQNLADTLNK